MSSRPAQRPLFVIRAFAGLSACLLIATSSMLTRPAMAATRWMAEIQAVIPQPIAIPGWSDAPETADADLPDFAEPLEGYRISSPFGHRTHPIAKRRHLHAGVDLAAPRGTTVHAVAHGTVVAIRSQRKGYGRHVIVAHPHGYSSYYAHLEEVAAGLRIGHTLQQGEALGTVGSSGSATGPHLHLEIRHLHVPQEPLALIDLPETAPMQAIPAALPVGVAPRWRATSAPP